MWWQTLGMPNMHNIILHCGKQLSYHSGVYYRSKIKVASTLCAADSWNTHQ